VPGHRPQPTPVHPKNAIGGSGPHNRNIAVTSLAQSSGSGSITTHAYRVMSIYNPEHFQLADERFPFVASAPLGPVVLAYPAQSFSDFDVYYDHVVRLEVRRPMTEPAPDRKKPGTDSA
jgi:hypothetical protein